MRRTAAALATFALSSTRLAGVTFAEAKQRHARVAAVKRAPGDAAVQKSATVATQESAQPEPLPVRAMPIKHFGGY